MLYSFMYELPKTNHRYGLSGIRLKVDAALQENDFVYIECEKLLVSNVKNHEEAHRQMIIEARKHFEKMRRQEQGAQLLREWFYGEEMDFNGQIKALVADEVGMSALKRFILLIVITFLIIHAIPGH